jgi:acyl-CoA thioester hydrolase
MRSQGVLSAEIEVDVPFHDIDMVGMIWHGHYLRYLENARWALMNRLGYGLERMIESGYGWPVVDVQVKYIRPGRFGERLRVRASLVEYEHRLALNYLVTDAATSERVARGRTVQVAVDVRSGAMQLDCPADFVEQVRACLARAKA